MYHQISLDEESQHYVTINTHKGLFEYQRLPFSVTSAPSIIQHLIENLLQGVSSVCVYIDDILVVGSTEAKHLLNLVEVLRRFECSSMKLKKEKCTFLLPSMSYLGHIISAVGLRTDTGKVHAVVEAPGLQNLSELQWFIGMVNYYSLFAFTLPPEVYYACGLHKHA